ncbi:translation factor GUF1 homolog, chloroplastic [Tanacetum coccineum]
MTTMNLKLILSSKPPQQQHRATTTSVSIPLPNTTFQSFNSSKINFNSRRKRRFQVLSKAVDVQDAEATALAGRDRLLKVPIERIRNFSIIAHIDHGKSTLADKLLQVTGTVQSREMKEQFLDNMDLERERGITIKLQVIVIQPGLSFHRRLRKSKPSPRWPSGKAARMRFAYEGQPYCLNLIDTPGHVDFSYEVSRSLAACEGALLVVDASQGVEAQTLANVYLALENNLEVIPSFNANIHQIIFTSSVTAAQVLNKIDLPGAEPSRVIQEIEEVIGLDCSNAIYCSAKEGIGINEILNAIVQRIPPPPNSAGRPLRALIFDSYYDAYRGVIVYFRVIDGSVKKGDRILFMASGKDYYADEVGVLSPNQLQVDELYAGEVGYISASIRSVADARVGDTITHYSRKAEESLPGYKEATPMVFCGLFPIDADQFPDLRDALEKLQLNDAALKVKLIPRFVFICLFEPETSSAMGFGFRCGFLGLLHMEIVQERLEREYNLSLITTAPSVVYKVFCVNGEIVECSNPSALPEQGKRKSIEEPIVKIEMLTPKDYIGSLMELSQDRRGEFKEMKFITEIRASLTYEMPLAEMVGDFFDQLKSRSKGYASMEYSFIGYKESDLIKLDVLINGEGVEPLSTIVHKDKAYSVGRALTQKLKELIPRQMFKVPIQACIGTKVIASEALSAIRKDVLAKCYGGDISRKKKLLKKQAAGKKRMKAIGKVDVPQEAFMAVLKLEKEVL